ncbi:hypothetical protein H9P43_000337 [Blastocladiella emersonii ATCC 22665]|nr:hypothetical protein H9P43_000337 [Blastocladiella emersonii ATCC 22665]
MFCLQALLPLLAFPRMAASPLFTLGYLASVFLHHRPCIYCLILFVGALWSTCYWGEGATCWATISPNPAVPTTGLDKDMDVLDKLIESPNATFSLSFAASLIKLRLLPVSPADYATWVTRWATPVHNDVLIPWRQQPAPKRAEPPMLAAAEAEDEVHKTVAVIDASGPEATVSDTSMDQALATDVSTDAAQETLDSLAAATGAVAATVVDPATP